MFRLASTSHILACILFVYFHIFWLNFSYILPHHSFVFFPITCLYSSCFHPYHLLVFFLTPLSSVLLVYFLIFCIFPHHLLRSCLYSFSPLGSILPVFIFTPCLYSVCILPHYFLACLASVSIIISSYCVTTSSPPPWPTLLFLGGCLHLPLLVLLTCVYFPILQVIVWYVIVMSTCILRWEDCFVLYHLSCYFISDPV